MIRYTTAPVDYDYNHVIDHGPVARTNRGKLIRKVELTDESRASFQLGRYASGLHTAITHEQLLEQFEYGLATPLEGPKVGVVSADEIAAHGYERRSND